jgi:predicted NBD/HSP70 family sugar kinase
VLRALRTAGPQRVADLMTRTGLSRPTVTQAISHLQHEGWVINCPDPDEPRMGRPAQLVQFNAGAGHVLGIDVGPHKVLAIVADLAGTVIAESRANTTAARTGNDVMVIVRSAMADALQTAGIGTTQISSAALGTPGVVDVAQGTVKLSPSIPGWAQIPIIAELRDDLICPISIDNDVNLAVLAEHGQTGSPPPQTLVFIQWGTRMGAGILINGQVHRGAASAAGEIGFFDLAETPTPPGQLGAFEQMVGSGAITQLATAATANPGFTDASAVLSAADAGDADALAVVDTIAARFARGIAPVLLVLDPDLVVIGGGVSTTGDALLAAVTRHLAARTLIPPQITLSGLGDRAVALGAIRRALDDVEERLFSPDALIENADGRGGVGV